jgi:hypothetical protein
MALVSACMANISIYIYIFFFFGYFPRNQLLWYQLEEYRRKERNNNKKEKEGGCVILPVGS